MGEKQQHCCALLPATQSSVNFAKAKFGREERIRTSGPGVPNAVLYQAELLPEPIA